jgi:ATP-dependent HslUV protease, peptidase subunit HslV
MSTIVAVRKGRKAVMAADSMFTQGSIKISPTVKVNHQKIFKVGDALVGFVGWTAMTQIFEDALLKYPKKFNFGSRKDIFRTFLFLHSKLKSEYFIETKERDNQPVESSQWDSVILTPLAIYSVQSYREVIEYKNYWAEGSGTSIALGALHAAYEAYDDPEKIARAAINAACEFDEGSGAPLQIQSIKCQEKRK